MSRTAHSDKMPEPPFSSGQSQVPLVIAAVGLLMTALLSPTSSPARLVSFIGVMFSVTGAVLAGVIWVATGRG